MGLFPEKSQVGLYVDSETICVVNGQIAGSAIRLTGFSELRQPVALEGDPDAKQKALDNIRTALNRAGVNSKSVLVSIPGDRSMTRHFELPVLPKKEERNAVRFEAQKYVPFDMKELYYDYETYFNTERKRNRVVFFACKKQWVDGLSALLTLASIKISRVELVSQSLARTFRRCASKNADEVSLLISCNDPNTAELVVQQHGSVLTTRHISLARAANDTALDVPMFVSDVRLSLDYFSENFSNLKVQRIHLATPFFGETQTACDALRKELSLPADAGNLFEPPSAASSTTAAAAAYGLTLGALEKQRTRRINLKPTEAMTAAPVLTWEEEKKQLQDLASKEIIGIAVLFAGLFFLLSSATNAKRQELQAAVASHPKAQGAGLTESVSDLQNKEALMTQKIAFFNLLVDKRVYFTTKMNELAKWVPPNVRLSQWSYTDEITPAGTSNVVMTIEGYVLSSDAGSELSVVNKLVSNLTGDGEFMQGFEEIRIARTAKEELPDRTVTKFTLDCSTKRQWP